MIRNKSPRVKSKPGAFQAGTLRFNEWDGLWKNSPGDSDVDRGEYEEVFSKLDLLWREAFQKSPHYIKDFYIRGDYTGDRTQIVEINNPKILNLKFLLAIQRWLFRPELDGWRIIIPTYLTKNETIVVYRSKVCISSKYEKSLAAGVRAIAARMRSF